MVCSTVLFRLSEIIYFSYDNPTFSIINLEPVLTALRTHKINLNGYINCFFDAPLLQLEFDLRRPVLVTDILVTDITDIHQSKEFVHH